MTTRSKLLMVLPVFLILGACLAPTDPGLPSDNEHKEPSEPGDGQSFNAVQAPVFLA
jgi:hypothetical protein